MLAALGMVLLYMPCLAATQGLALHSLGREAARWREDLEQWKGCTALPVNEAGLREAVDLTGKFLMPHKSLLSLSCPCSAGGRGLMEGRSTPASQIEGRSTPASMTKASSSNIACVDQQRAGPAAEHAGRRCFAEGSMMNMYQGTGLSCYVGNSVCVCSVLAHSQADKVLPQIASNISKATRLWATNELLV